MSSARPHVEVQNHHLRIVGVEIVMHVVSARILRS